MATTPQVNPTTRAEPQEGLQPQHAAQKSNLETLGRSGRRLVIFAGPHKSASSSLQEFFVTYASGRRKYRNLVAFQQWRWPKVDTAQTKRIPERKIFSRLVMNHTTKDQVEAGREDLSISVRNDIWAAIQHTWNNPQRIMLKKADGAKAEPTMGYVNVVIASEEFDRFGLTPFSGRDGIQAIRDVVQLIRPPHLDIVVNYRTPRHKHWLSIWKQLTAIESRLENKEAARRAAVEQTNSLYNAESQEKARLRSGYQNFICNNEKVWEYLDCVSNPLGLVHELRLNRWNVTLIDMGGVEEQQMDISHASSCRVLQVPCTTDGWVRGIVNHTLSFNTKTRSSDLSDQDLDEMEWLFRKRDCAYVSRIKDDPGVRILFRQSLWKDCNLQQEEHIYRQLLNTTFFMQLLQAPYQCSTATMHDPLNLTQWIESVATLPSLSPPPKRRSQRLHPHGKGSDFSPTEDTHDSHLFILLYIQFGTALLIFIILALTRLKKHRTRRPHHTDKAISA